MHVITRKRLNEFAKLHPNTKSALAQWYTIFKQNDFSSFIELRQLFPAADQVGKLTVFNIGGNKVHLIAAIHYNRKKVYIRAVLTHVEYDEERWKTWFRALILSKRLLLGNLFPTPYLFPIPRMSMSI